MTLTEQLDRLAAFDPTGAPVVSLYLNTQPDQHGRDHFHAFVRKELKARTETYPAGPEREGLERDRERIEQYLDHDLKPSANGLCVFACDAAGLFEAIQLEAPIEEHWLSIGNEPHLYSLARVAALFPRYAALLADTNTARILVIAEGNVEARSSVAGVKTHRTSQGGWSQARFQRRNENVHVHHVKEVIDALEKIVERERIDRIVIAGDAVVLPLIREQMPKHLAEKVVDEMSIAAKAPERDVVQSTLETMRAADERSEHERVEAVIGAYRAGGLAAVGPDATLLALTNGQVDELFLAAALEELSTLGGSADAAMAIANDAALADRAVETAVAGEPERAGPERVRLADELVTKARQTGARVTIVQDPALLAPFGGVAAGLRYVTGAR